MISCHAIQQPTLWDAPKEVTGKQIYIAFGIGMAIDLASIYIGDPYIISLLLIPVAAALTFKWLKKPVPWIVLVSVIAANPVNINAPIALNLIFVSFLLMLNIFYLSKLPSWVYFVLLAAFLSILGSVANWSTAGGFLTQFAAIVNYVVGPFSLIPLVYFRLQRERDSDLLLKGFVFSFIVPSVIFMFLALTFGDPRYDAGTNVIGDLIAVPVYHFGNVDFHFVRTHVGIPISALICASFAVIFSVVSNRIRLIVFFFLIISIYLLLVTGSIGSSLAALGGIVAILVVAKRYLPLKRHLVALTICVGLAVFGWSLLPQEIKYYFNSRYEQRFSGGSVDVSDRSEQWYKSLGYLLDNPEGRGWELYVDSIGGYPHNDYLSYGIAFGFVCGLLYLVVPAVILVSMSAHKGHVIDPAQIAILLAGIGTATVFLINSFSDHLAANRWYFNVVWSMIWYCFFTSKAKAVTYNK